MDKKYLKSIFYSKKYKIILINLFFLFLFWIIFFPILNNKIISSKLVNYSKLVETIQFYKQKNGQYPNNLDQLVPIYLKEILPIKEVIGYDLLIYETNVSNSKYTNFIGDGPDYILSFWKSYGVGGAKEIRYCPKRFECKYEINFPIKIGGEVVYEKRILNAERIDDDWVFLESY